ncbi:MAG: hypothetical protein LJE60_01390 [Thiocapsa sp.]|nr:PilX N-terminal domain-containing pilus assembly protein [Thiocapsa sp.]MCG6895751.1 hypothetical protein [Thiocapsa sp.]
MTLMVGFLLLTASTILTIAVARMGVMEQRIANNELRAKEAQQAAQSGLDYALAWLSTNVWSAGTEIPPPPQISASGDYRYGIRLTLDDRPGCLRVHSEAHATGDESIYAAATQCFQQKRPLRDAMARGVPPLVVGGCLSGVTGNANVYPSRCDPGRDDGCDRASVVSSHPLSCLDPGSLYLNGGSLRGNAFEGPAWEYLFAISQEEYKARAEDGDPRFLWITSTLRWDSDMGQPKEPIYMVFTESAGCPEVSGSVSVYGIVYFAEDAGCGSRGWGDAAVYGSVVFEDALEGLTARGRLYHWSWAVDNEEGASLNIVTSTHRVPGSWRDWEPDG